MKVFYARLTADELEALIDKTNVKHTQAVKKSKAARKAARKAASNSKAAS